MSGRAARDHRRVEALEESAEVATLQLERQRVAHEVTRRVGDALRLALVRAEALEHEGQVVSAGEKMILSVNVWAHRKRAGLNLTN